ncbi:hypothetical protein Tco_0302664, partial [Tanacetum coccineum]
FPQYEEEEWYDPIFLKNRSSNYETANMEQELEAMECQVDLLMKEAISLVEKSENLCRIVSKKIWQSFPRPSRQKEFEGLMTNFILDQEEKVRQLEEYISIIGNEFINYLSMLWRNSRTK